MKPIPSPRAHRRLATVALVAALTCVTPVLAQPVEEGAAEELVELSFSVDAEVGSFTVTADVLAGGRLLMARREGGKGGATLSLVRPIEHPWKLYWVDPLGPAEEVKLATEVTLPEGSWPALAAARSEADRFAAEAHGRWAERGRTRRPFDGAFAFVVIGRPEGRFEVALDPGGRVSAVTNRMTDRWRPGGIEPLFPAWADGHGDRAGEGYWFWNEGEGEPPAWEPHTYHALAAALELLALPAFPAGNPEKVAMRGQGAAYTLAQPDLAGRARRVVETLTPRTRGRLGGAAEEEVEVRFTVLEASPERLGVEGRTAPVERGGDGVELTRRIVYDRRLRRVESDEARVAVTLRGGRLEVRVGYRPAGEEPGPRESAAGPSGL